MYSQTFKEVFPKNLNRYLTQYNMSQHELARRLNVSPTAVNNWCTGVKAPRMDKVDKMCRIFHCRRSDLVEPYQDEAECYTVIGKRIKKIRQEHNLTQLDIAKICGVTDGAVSTWERGVAAPRIGALQKLADYLGIKVSELIEDDATFPVDLSDYVMIPVYGRIPAGAPKLEEEFIEDHIPIPRSWTIGGVEYGGLTVKGESMLPLIQDGDTVVYRHQPTVENGSICIARVDHYDATVKKFVQHDSRTIILQPLNSEYDPIIFTGDASEPALEIIGKVVEVRHAL